MKILVNLRNINIYKGGVANHFAGLKDKFSQEVYYNFIGGKSNSRFFLPLQFLDYIKFCVTLIKFKPDLVHLNPSLDKNSVVREAAFIILSKLFRRKVLVFWHGWDGSYEKKLNEGHAKLFKLIFNQADAFCVLAKRFKIQLEEWGFDKPIFLETTKVDDSLLMGFDINNKHHNRVVLFLARIEKNKGIYVAIDSISGNDDLQLLVAGTGTELEKVKQYVDDNDIKNVEFLGYVSGERKIEAFNRCSVYILPTTHGEGMPTSVLEAMALGLPIISRPVGGIMDFFENGKMGYLTESVDPEEFRNLIEKLIYDREKAMEISRYNHQYAKKRFLASRVAKRLESIYEEIHHA